ncbi:MULTISPECIES: hypothetical protein [unclassified Empedobacter]|uniref:hypothetical protein n=1 Tax=unclassified Empedobacter TaxID=2643773 RepID=UPI0025BB9CDA|nr:MULTISPECIES: hypothetical protein [unclassified Empedobacter]
MVKQLTLEVQTKIISQFLNLLLFDEINSPKFEKIDGFKLKELSKSYKIKVLKTTDGFTPFINDTIIKFLSSLDENDKYFLYLLIISTAYTSSDIILPKESNLKKTHFDILDSIDKNQKNINVNLFFRKIIAENGGIPIYDSKYIEKRWYEKTIEKQLDQYYNY